MFKRMITTIKNNIEFFCYHGREALVLELLWKEIKRKNHKVPAEQRRDTLIRQITELCEAHQ